MAGRRGWVGVGVDVGMGGWRNVEVGGCACPVSVVAVVVAVVVVVVVMVVVMEAYCRKSTLKISTESKGRRDCRVRRASHIEAHRPEATAAGPVQEVEEEECVYMCMCVSSLWSWCCSS
jgi:hypothetical protein